MSAGGLNIRKYLLREHGSWGVMSMAFAAGLIAAGHVNLRSLCSFLSIVLFINSKQALTLYIRGRKGGRTKPFVIFAFQVLLGLLFILLISYRDLVQLIPYAMVPLIYVLCLIFLGEHSVITEISGFVLLSLSSLIAGYSVAFVIDPLIFVIASVFFVAGVFRVRIQFKKEVFYRILMPVYVAAAAIFFRLAGLPVLLLLPLVDNVVFSVTLYRAGLAATGWIEMSKGIVFLALLAYLR